MKKKTGCWILAGFGLLSYFLYKQNNDIVTTNYTYVSNKVPTVFDGMKIVHLSDLHNKTFKESQRTLLSKIKRAHPDVVFITGDIVDSRRYHDKPSLILVNKLAQKWPVYYVTGNHERNSNHFHQLEPLIKKAGIYVLRNQTKVYTKQEDHIYISGIDDPSFAIDFPDSDDATFTENALQTAQKEFDVQDSLCILLSHRPELMHLYAKQQFDIVFTGHAHGGQIRIPFIGGLIAPHQGFFPDYTAGLHEIRKTIMVINRGLGNSLFPFRVFNRPEVIVLTLKSGL